MADDADSGLMQSEGKNGGRPEDAALQGQLGRVLVDGRVYLVAWRWSASSNLLGLTKCLLRAL
jgi:hypothetical protein